MQLFGTDLLKTYRAHDDEMTSMRRRYVASTSLRRHVPAGSLAPPKYSKPWPPQYSKPSYAYVFVKLKVNWYAHRGSHSTIIILKLWKAKNLLLKE